VVKKIIEAMAIGGLLPAALLSYLGENGVKGENGRRKWGEKMGSNLCC
jgi:hypothetical protein